MRGRLNGIGVGWRPSLEPWGVAWGIVPVAFVVCVRFWSSEFVRMPRPSLIKVALPQFKGRSNFQAHKVRRDDFFDNPALRYPIYTRLPELWRKEFEAKPPTINQKFVQGTKRPQHSGLWVKDPKGLPVEVNNVPIKVTYTEEIKAGLWGGEGFIIGFKHARGKKNKPYTYKRWKPYTLQKTFFSEVLEREIETTVTTRTLDLIDAAFGFDHYILKTPVHELCSTLGGNLKREMLLRLLDKDTEMYKLDPEAREKVYKRYENYVIPREQAEWVGLSLREAMDKQWNSEKDQGLHDSVPLLKIYTEELRKKLEEQKANLDDKEVEQDSNDLVGIFYSPPKVKT